MTDHYNCRPPADLPERRRAVDVSRSFIVQAPAGSGKTELLVQRILALLAVVDAPEEILAITFTRKAAGEMRHRLLEALAGAGNDQPPAEAHARETWQRARLALQTNVEKGWYLQQNPSRLQVMTIDSLCALLTRRMPWLSGFGAQPTIAGQPEDLYLAAADRLVSRVERKTEGQEAIERLLNHLDNRMVLLRDMLVAMLGKRDQWLRHMLGQQATASRVLLEAGLQSCIAATLARTRSALGEEACRDLAELGVYAAGNLAGTANHPLLALSGETMLCAEAAALDAWLAIAHLTLTADGSIRRSIDKRLGFPADKNPSAIAAKSRMVACLDALRTNAHAQASLLELRQLPAAVYTPEQWDILEALIKLLPLAVLELREVFRSRGEVDFIEIAGAAQAALGDAENPEELLLQLDSRISHVLVDEFQDTSLAQFMLLQKLTAGWTPGDGRTLFVVGDPMQSIYRFREAEVGIFLRVCSQGINDLFLESIVLTANFRSQAKLVEWSNRFFVELFPTREDPLRGAVCFAPAASVRADLAGEAVSFHGYHDRQDRQEAKQVVELVSQARGNDPEGTVAILVRSRNHLVEIITALKEADLHFQAQEIDPLSDRPVVQDLLALTRALLHPADRIAWLAVLRAPWCGLCLKDLLVICDRGGQGETLRELLDESQRQTELFDRVSDDGQSRLGRIFEILDRASRMKGRLPLRQLVESTWLSLGGPACIDETGRKDAGQVFLLLDTLNDGGDLVSFDLLEQRLVRLFAAADPQAGPELQVMTIHKAKGLEFDTVILPGLGRGVRGPDRALLRWLEHPAYELLLAPVPPATDDSAEPTYQAIGRLLKDKEDLETLRLFYVAATRAKNRLHLLGHFRLNSEGCPYPAPGSFLDKIWPAAAELMTTGVQAPSVSQKPARTAALLKRLPASWSPPVLPSRVAVAGPAVRRASDHDSPAEAAIAASIAGEDRVVGNMVHGLLEQVAETGLEEWSDVRLNSQRSVLTSRLFSQGIPANRHEVCIDNILEYLKKCITCQRGVWLLSDHPDAHCELAINGLVDGDLVYAVIDRTFVDKGIRWVVDYKTSQPGQAETFESFLGREQRRYARQMKTYRCLMQAYDTGHPVRAALYFPMIDGWVEVTEPD